jgi:hypothetical protein
MAHPALLFAQDMLPRPEQPFKSIPMEKQNVSTLKTYQSPAVTFVRDGSAHIVDLTIPIPKTISEEAQAMLTAAAMAPHPSPEPTQTVADVRAAHAEMQARLTEQLLRMYPVTVEKKSLGGVPVTLVTPTNARADLEDRLLINLHGGAFFLARARSGKLSQLQREPASRCWLSTTGSRLRHRSLLRSTTPLQYTVSF